jgi:hypothetical protein
VSLPTLATVLPVPLPHALHPLLAALFPRLSSAYALLFLSLSTQVRDAILCIYTDILAQMIYISLIYAYPATIAHMNTVAAKTAISDTVSHLLLGVPTVFSTSAWLVPELIRQNSESNSQTAHAPTPAPSLAVAANLRVALSDGNTGLLEKPEHTYNIIDKIKKMNQLYAESDDTTDITADTTTDTAASASDANTADASLYRDLPRSYLTSDAAIAKLIGARACAALAIGEDADESGSGEGRSGGKRVGGGRQQEDVSAAADTELVMRMPGDSAPNAYDTRILSRSGGSNRAFRSLLHSSIGKYAVPKGSAAAPRQWVPRSRYSAHSGLIWLFLALNTPKAPARTVDSRGQLIEAKPRGKGGDAGAGAGSGAGAGDVPQLQDRRPSQQSSSSLTLAQTQPSALTSSSSSSLPFPLPDRGPRGRRMREQQLAAEGRRAGGGVAGRGSGEGRLRESGASISGRTSGAAKSFPLVPHGADASAAAAKPPSVHVPIHERNPHDRVLPLLAKARANTALLHEMHKHTHNLTKAYNSSIASANRESLSDARVLADTLRRINAARRATRQVGVGAILRARQRDTSGSMPGGDSVGGDGVNGDDDGGVAGAYLDEERQQWGSLDDNRVRLDENIIGSMNIIYGLEGEDAGELDPSLRLYRGEKSKPRARYSNVDSDAAIIRSIATKAMEYKAVLHKHQGKRRGLQ